MITEFQIIKKERIDEIYGKFKIDTFEKIILTFDIEQNYILTEVLELIEGFLGLKKKDDFFLSSNNMLECFTK